MDDDAKRLLWVSPFSLSALIWLCTVGYYAKQLNQIGGSSGTEKISYEVLSVRRQLVTIALEESREKIVFLSILLGLAIISLAAFWFYEERLRVGKYGYLGEVWGGLSAIASAVLAVLVWALVLYRLALQRFTTLDALTNEALYESWVMVFVLIAPVLVITALIWALDLGIVLPAMGLWVIIRFIGYVNW